MEKSKNENVEILSEGNSDVVLSDKLSIQSKSSDSKSSSIYENDGSLLINEEYKDIVAETQNKLLSMHLDFNGLQGKHGTHFSSTPKAYPNCHRLIENPDSSRNNDGIETPINFRTMYSSALSDSKHSRPSNGFDSFNQSNSQFYSCLNQSNQHSPWVSKATFSPEINGLLETDSLDETFPDVKVVPNTLYNENNKSPDYNEMNLSKHKSRSKNSKKLMLDFDEFILLRKLKQALKCLGISSAESQWESICKMMKAKDDDLVRFGDFVQVAKKVFFKEMDRKRVTCGSLFFTAIDGNFTNRSFEKENSGNSQDKTMKVDDLESEICKLKNDLKETEHKCCLAENELLFVRKKLQEAIQNNRDISNKLKAIPQASKEVQTDIDYEKSLHHLHQSLYNSRWLYEIATNKLLQFTQMVHDILIAYNEEKAAENRRPHKSPQALKRPTSRATTVKIANNDVSNYFVHKYGGGGRVCRAASVCTVGCSGKSVQKNTNEGNQLQQLADKAQELVQAITSILEEEKKSLTSTSYGKRLKYNSDNRHRKETVRQQPVERCKSVGFVKPKKDIIAWV